MGRTAIEYRRAGTAEPRRGGRAGGGWAVQAGLLGTSVVLLTLAFAPLGQFYLAYVGLVPFLLAVRLMRGWRGTVLLSWAGGIAFFGANMWWLAYITVPGMVALLVYLGLFWPMTALVLRGLGWRDWPGGAVADGAARETAARETGVARHGWREGMRSVGMLLAIPAVWTAFEWLRGTAFTGLPWLFVGHTQSPALILCQIADAGGAYAVSFFVVMFNALLAIWAARRRDAAGMAAPAVVMAVVTAGVVAYGLWRMSEETRVRGPRVMMVQANYPQDNSGNKGVAPDKIVVDHLRLTREALKSGPSPDLIVWSETMMPPLNPEARSALLEVAEFENMGRFYEDVVKAVQELSTRSRAAVLTGGDFARFVVKYSDKGKERLSVVAKPVDRRNSAFFFMPDGAGPAARYDKIHLVPFGEFIPCKSWCPPLYRMFLALSPYDSDYTLTAGSEDAMTVFTMGPSAPQPWRFVTPICFEDIVPPLVAQMARGRDGQKRADFLVNVTNDGWYKGGENAQHMQVAIFRSIENRMAMARCVNTGISGFIDSLGRVGPSLAVRTEGVVVADIEIDSRVSVFTRVGDLFAEACAAAVGLALAGRRLWGARAKAGEAA